MSFVYDLIFTLRTQPKKTRQLATWLLLNAEILLSTSCTKRANEHICASEEKFSQPTQSKMAEI